MRTFVDVHDYAMSSISSPWHLIDANGPSISGEKIVWPNNFNINRCARDPFSGNWLMSFSGTIETNPFSTALFQVYFENASGSDVRLQINGFDGPDGNTPVVYAYGQIGFNPADWGDFKWTLDDYPSENVSIPKSFSLQFACQPSLRRAHANLTIGGVRYASGWQEWAAGQNFAVPVFEATYAVQIGTITGYDELTESQILGAIESGEAPVALPTHSIILPDSTAKISHARILASHRSHSQAQNFHEIMKEATS